MFRSFTPLALLPAAAVIVLAGCGKPGPRVYLAPKEGQEGIVAAPTPATTPAPATTSAPKTAAAPAPEKAEKLEKPEMTFMVPATWKETQGNSVSTATYEVASAAGKATLAVTPLSGFEGKEAVVVNMWREQLGAAAQSPEEVAKALTPAQVGGEKAQQYEATGTRDGKTWRLLAAMLHRPDGTWFFKFMGDDAVVTAERENFTKFLQTVKMGEAPAATAGQGLTAAPAPTNVPAGPARTNASPGLAEAAPGTLPAKAQPSSASTAPSGSAPAGSGWVAPEGWRLLPAGPMQVAKFAVPEQAGAKAEVAVSVFPSDTGGALANVNRWRGQLGLPGVGEAEMASMIKPLPGGSQGATLTSITAEGRQILVAIVPRDGAWWFYKLMGDTPAVTAAESALTKLALSAPPAG